MGNILLILLMENLMLRQRLGVGMVLGLRVMMICRPTTFHTGIHQTVVYPGGQPIATASPHEQPQPQQQEQGPPQSDGPFFIETSWITIDCPSHTTLITCNQTIPVPTPEPIVCPRHTTLIADPQDSQPSSHVTATA